MNECIQMFHGKGNYILEIKSHKLITGKHVILWTKESEYITSLAVEQNLFKKKKNF